MAHQGYIGPIPSHHLQTLSVGQRSPRLRTFRHLASRPTIFRYPSGQRQLAFSSMLESRQDTYGMVPVYPHSLINSSCAWSIYRKYGRKTPVLWICRAWIWWLDTKSSNTVTAPGRLALPGILLTHISAVR